MIDKRKKYKHQKIKNTGLLFEFLLRQITSDVLGNKKSRMVEVIKKRFNEKTELGKELSLYNILVNSKFSSDKKADFLIGEVLKERKSLNNSLLRKEKYNLIKEVKEYFNLQRFLSSSVDNYKVYASTYKLFEYYNQISPEEKTILYFNLVENITTNKQNVKLVDVINNNIPTNDKDLQILTYKILLEKFNKKYVKLDKSQKSLLKLYINNISNTNQLWEHVQGELPNLKIELLDVVEQVDDSIVKIKLNEVINDIGKFCKLDEKLGIVKDATIIQLMRYYELLKELKKHGRK